MAPTLKIYVTMFFVEGENSNMADRVTQLSNLMNAKLSQQRFWPCQDGFIKTIPMIPPQPICEVQVRFSVLWISRKNQDKP